MTTNTAADKLTAQLTATYPAHKVAIETTTGTYCVRVAGEPTVTVRFMPLLAA